MLSNYFTFLHCARLLNERYAGSVIAEVYSQEKNTLCILLYTPEPYTLKVSCMPRENFIFARKGDIRARTNSVDLFPSLINATVTSAYMDSADRILYLKISNGSTLLIEMFGSKANVILCSSDGTITDVFQNKKELLGKQRIIQYDAEKISVNNFIPEKVSFMSTLQTSNEKSLAVSLKKIIPKLGTTLATEVLYRAHLTADVKQQTLSTTDYTAIYESTYQLVSEMLQPADKLNPSIYFDVQTPVAFSIVPLQHCSPYRKESHDDLFEAIQKFLSFGKSFLSFVQEKNKISSWIGKELDKISRTLLAIESELAESSRAEQYELFARLLLSNLQNVKKGMKSAELENSFSHNELITIALDPSLSPAQNAERYFEKAKKSKTGRLEAQDRFAALQQRHSALTKLREELEEVSAGPPGKSGEASISFKNFLHLYNKELHRLGFMTEKEEEELPPFKIFTVDGGFTVYAGKSSENNDLLTVKFARPNDLWFHSRGSSGSHVVLKVGSGIGKPSKKAIQQAAAIAAYYSKMKNAKTVPIAITEKKYVRKPKGAPAGTVVIEREKVIFVEPGLPEQGK